MKYKNILIFIGRFISCVFLSLMLMQLNAFHNIKTNTTQINSNTTQMNEENKYVKSVENLDEGYSILINGKENDIQAFKIGKDTYVNIKELQESFNNLRVVNFNKIISIYETTGLGIVEYRGEEYIEYGNIMDRYSVKFEELPYASIIERRLVFKHEESAPTLSFTRVAMETPETHYYRDLFVRKTELMDKLSTVFDIIHTNELYIKDLSQPFTPAIKNFFLFKIILNFVFHYIKRNYFQNLYNTKNTQIFFNRCYYHNYI